MRALIRKRQCLKKKKKKRTSGGLLTQNTFESCLVFFSVFFVFIPIAMRLFNVLLVRFFSKSVFDVLIVWSSSSKEHPKKIGLSIPQHGVKKMFVACTDTQYS